MKKPEFEGWTRKEIVEMTEPLQLMRVNVELKSLVVATSMNNIVAGYEVKVEGGDEIRDVSKILYCTLLKPKVPIFINMVRIRSFS